MKFYTANNLRAAIALLERTLKNDKFLVDSEDLAAAQKLVIESTLLEDSSDPDFHKNYEAKLLDFQEFMLALVVILREPELSADSSVMLLARKTLKMYLDWEVERYPIKEHRVVTQENALEIYSQWLEKKHHNNTYPTQGDHRPLDDDEYLESLEEALREMISDLKRMHKDTNKNPGEFYLSFCLDVLNRFKK
ncbi:hypothetical protein H0H93_010737 [Arthromyces matolae]|nr:hypothetical protein H0H93_010737 [Arthromyces matolae]